MQCAWRGVGRSGTSSWARAGGRRISELSNYADCITGTCTAHATGTLPTTSSFGEAANATLARRPKATQAPVGVQPARRVHASLAKTEPECAVLFQKNNCTKATLEYNKPILHESGLHCHGQNSFDEDSGAI